MVGGVLKILEYSIFVKRISLSFRLFLFYIVRKRMSNSNDAGKKTVSKK